MRFFSPGFSSVNCIQTFKYKFDGFFFFIFISGCRGRGRNNILPKPEDYKSRAFVPLMAYNGGFWPIRGVKRKYAKRK